MFGEIRNMACRFVNYVCFGLVRVMFFACKTEFSMACRLNDYNFSILQVSLSATMIIGILGPCLFS